MIVLEKVLFAGLENVGYNWQENVVYGYHDGIMNVAYNGPCSGKICKAKYKLSPKIVEL